MEASNNSWLVIGLGNPGEEYKLSRHNVGWMFIDFILKKTKGKLAPGKGNYLYAIVDNGVLVKPTTFMNNSGIAVLQAIEDFSWKNTENILVVLDDIDLPFRKLRLRKKGGSGGHKGLESVIFHLNTEDIPRLRIGIGRSPDMEPAIYVLSSFIEEELRELNNIFGRAYNGFQMLLKNDFGKAENYLNRMPEEEVEI